MVQSVFPSDSFSIYRSQCDASIGRSWDSHRQACETEDWLAAGVWGAVFLEGFLEFVCLSLSLNVGDRPDLGGVINRLRQKKDLTNGREALDLCDGVRLARNALVHSGISTGEATEVHGRAIAGYLAQFLRASQSWLPEFAPAARATDPAFPPARAKIFLSTISPHMPRQEGFLRDLELEMRNAELEPVRVTFDEYDRRDPVGKIVHTMEACDGLLAVGLSRTHAYFLRDREGSARQKEEMHRHYTSGWLHLEAGIAFSQRKPVLVLCELVLAKDGIFDLDWNSSQPFVMTSAPPSIDDPQVQACLKRLKAEVLRATGTN